MNVSVVDVKIHIFFADSASTADPTFELLTPDIGMGSVGGVASSIPRSKFRTRVVYCSVKSGISKTEGGGTSTKNLCWAQDRGVVSCPSSLCSR